MTLQTGGLGASGACAVLLFCTSCCKWVMRVMNAGRRWFASEVFRTVVRGIDQSTGDDGGVLIALRRELTLLEDALNAKSGDVPREYIEVFREYGSALRSAVQGNNPKAMTQSGAGDEDVAVEASVLNRWIWLFGSR